MNRFTNRALLGTAAATLASSASAAVVDVTADDQTLVNFTLQTQIDPLNVRQDVDVVGTGATAETILEGLANIQVLQDSRQSTDGTFGGNALVGPGTDYFVFTDGTAPDFAVIDGPGSRSNSGEASSGGDNTSNGEGITLVAQDFATPTMIIDFGQYDFGDDGEAGGDDDTFDNMLIVVNAAGLTISDVRTGEVATAVFKDNDGNVLSTQTGAGGDEGGGLEIYFGWQDLTGVGIGSIELSRTTVGQSQRANVSDIAFTGAIVIPEPASLALLAAGALCVASRRPQA